MWQRVVLYLILSISALSAQGFLYSYIDPCNQTIVRDNYNLQPMNGGFYVTYYNKSKFFTFEQIVDGTLENWTQKVYNDFEDLFPCAVRVAEEILSSVLASNATEQFTKQDVSNDVGAVNYGIKTSPTVDSSWVTSFNSIYTRESFDGKSRYDGNFSFTNDFSRFSTSYGQGINFLAKKQNQVISASGVFFRTFEGSDWLVSTSYAKSLVKRNAEVIVLTGAYGSVSEQAFGNLSVLYGMRTPLELSFGKVTFTNYISYTLLRYYKGLNSGKQYLLLKSPIILMPTLSFDFQLSQAFKVNLGFSMGYNTVVNDYGERTITYAIMFGTYF